MKRRKSGVGAELAPLILILACLAGSFGSLIAVYRRVNVARSVPTRPPAVVVVMPPAPPVSPPAPPTPEAEPVLAPIVAIHSPPEDPTPKAVTPILAAEAEQLLEASQANRQAQALEAARQAAEVESDRWRRRQSLIHSQINTLESRVRKVEVNLDQMALERDALERELDDRKAAVARAKSRPGQAILPHKGPNGTWRRPIIVECRNGTAVIQPQGLEFGLRDLETGFGPSSNRFVNAIAREAVRVQRQASPDGSLVVPYIFFLVRPDGIRPYYEARGRLEPLGITFGYELADADWQVEFPNLDDVATWDGSAAGSAPNPVVTGRSNRDAEDTELPTWPDARPAGRGAPGTDPAGPFTFGPATMPGGANSRFAAFLGQPRPAPSPGSGLVATADGPAAGGPDRSSSSDNAGLDLPGTRGPSPGEPALEPAGNAGGPRVTAAGRILPESSSVKSAPTGNPDQGDRLDPGRGDEPDLSRLQAAPTTADTDPPDAADPGTTFVWSGDRNSKAKGDPGSDLPTIPLEPIESGDETDPIRGLSGTRADVSSGRPDRTQSGPAGGSQAVRRRIGPRGPSEPALPGSPLPVPGALGVGLPSSPVPLASPSSMPKLAVTPPSMNAVPPLPLSMVTPPHLPTPTEISAAVQRQTSPNMTPALPPLDQPDTIIDRSFEIVVVCNPQGVILQPGTYRITADALKDREGLFKKEVVALVKARRLADPTTQVEPRIRFLIQPRGYETYRLARSQFFVSGLTWPTTTELANPDPLAITTSGAR